MKKFLLLIKNTNMKIMPIRNISTSNVKKLPKNIKNSNVEKEHSALHDNIITAGILSIPFLTCEIALRVSRFFNRKSD